MKMAVLEKKKRLPRRAALPVDGKRLVLNEIPWKAYKQLSELMGESNIHLTFDQGRLEIMPLSMEHERNKCVLRMMVDVLAEERNLPIKSVGSMTHQRDDLEKGLEPDQCYYHRNLRAVLRKKWLDLSRDPPPDLALEIDITSSSLNRMAIYAALGIAEGWRFDGETLIFHVLDDGDYRPSEQSPTFPGFHAAELIPFLALGQRLDDAAFRRRFRTWVRETLKP